MQVAEIAAKQNPEIFVEQNVKTATAAFQQFVAVGMEGADLQPDGIRAAQFPLGSIQHFFRSIFGVGEGENLVRAGMAIAD